MDLTVNYISYKLTLSQRNLVKFHLIALVMEPGALVFNHCENTLLFVTLCHELEQFTVLLSNPRLRVLRPIRPLEMPEL